VTYNAATFAAVLTPASRLAVLTSYTVGVSTGVKDVAGNALAVAFSSSFETQAQDLTPPTVSSVSPANGATGVGLGAVVTVTFSKAVDPATISGSRITLQDGGGNPVAAAVTYNSSTFTATLTPNARLHPDTNYIATVKAGVADLFGNVLASDFVWSFTTALTIWSDSSQPITALSGETIPYELGVKFTSDVSGYVTGVRFYKGGVANGGTHIGHLWAGTGGAALASATFTGETDSGWQEVDFATPVFITANTMYIASYYAPEGNYAFDTGSQAGGLVAGVDNPPLHAVANTVSANGVYVQQPGGGFPNQSGNNGANYWVDVVFERGLTVSGAVAYYPTNYPPSGLSTTRVDNVTMTLTGDTSLRVVTLADGSYGLSGIAAGGTYCVTPSKTDDNPPANGVDVGDLIAIQKQILVIAPLASPYARLAADVNADGSIDVGDLIAIRQLILGMTNSLPAGLWRFVPTNYVFLDPQNPWNAPSNHWYTNLVADVTNGDFVAIKLGDVDNSWMAPLGGQSLLAKSVQGSQALAKSTVPGVEFAVSQQNAQPGQRVTVGVTVSGFSQVCGAQFTLAWDPAVLRYEETGSYGLTGLSAECFGTALAESGKLGFVWYDPTVVGVTLADGSVLFTVSFEVIGKAGSVSAVALAGAPTAQAVSVDFALGAFGAQDGSVTVVGPGAVVSNPGYAKGAFRLSVPTEQGRSYILEFTDTLAPANWTALPAVVGDGTVNILVDPAATNHQRFYRVHIQ
jgi:hypothetical protein